MASAPLVEIRGLVKRYGGRTAVDGVDLTVFPAEVVALLGPNGAGKTTVMKCLLGLVRPDGGEVHLAGVDLTRDGARARALLGYVPQRTDFGDELTGNEMLGLVARLRLLGEDAVAAAVRYAGVDGLLDRPLDTLSGGQVQRVLLAQALLGDPPLLVFDEPTVSLDPVAQHEYVAMVRALRSEGRSVLISSHLLAEVEQIADRALVLQDGRTVALWPRAAWQERGLERLFLDAVRVGAAAPLSLVAAGEGAA